MLGRKFNDEKLIRQAKDGSAEAFGELYQRYVEVIFRYLFTHINDRADAEDLTEEVFFKCWNALSTYDSRGLPLSSFLFKIARNSLIDHYRLHKEVEPFDEVKFQTNDADPETELDDKQTRSILQNALSQLREDYRSVIIFRFLSGLSPEETADMMQRSAGAVRVLQHRALAALRELLTKDSDERPE